uniref:Glycosyltransferase 2-like domain-containing protein n=1 Tax=viral metagenome TaxID=1070528 RepID=A0A6C0DJ82_9ZZZZ
MNNKLTFIIPSIGRNTLQNTIQSLENQTNANWCAIIIFDGCTPNFKTTNPKIKIIQIEKLGQGVNSAGLVRNEGIKLAETEWIAFVDDDDTLAINYVETFYEELQFFHDMYGGVVCDVSGCDYEVVDGSGSLVCDMSGVIDASGCHYARIDGSGSLVCDMSGVIDASGCIENKATKNDYEPDVIIFRMKTYYGDICPDLSTDNFYNGKVGISFAMKKTIFNNNIIFVPSCTEDYFILDKIRENNYKIMISPYLRYFVRNIPKEEIDAFTKNKIIGNRVLLNI